jgi:hypothetical protein
MLQSTFAPRKQRNPSIARVPTQLHPNNQQSIFNCFPACNPFPETHRDQPLACHSMPAQHPLNVASSPSGRLGVLIMGSSAPSRSGCSVGGDGVAGAGAGCRCGAAGARHRGHRAEVGDHHGENQAWPRTPTSVSVVSGRKESTARKGLLVTAFCTKGDQKGTDGCSYSQKCVMQCNAMQRNMTLPCSPVSIDMVLQVIT